jgi:putative ABC transport system permease protein
MNDSRQNQRWWRWLIRLIGVLVPRRLRADWRQEWEAELQWRESQLAEWDKLSRQNKFDLLWHSAGAFMDALWLQPRRWEDEMIQDIRYGARLLLKKPGFTALVLLTLALGIGVNLAIFTVVNSVLLRPLPYRAADRLVKILEIGRQPRLDRRYVTLGDFAEWRKQSQSFEGMAAVGQIGLRMTGAGDPENTSANEVSANLFELLGVRAALGRTFLPADESPDSTAVAVLSHQYWTTRFGADPTIIGKTLNLNERPHTIIGVLPADFRETFESIPGRAQLWTPVIWNEQALTRHGPGGRMVLACLRPGVSLTQAQAEMNVLAERLAQTYPKSNSGIGAAVYRLHEEVTGNSRETLLIFGVAACFVLLIAGANVAGLMLTRGIEREREIAIRAALGAGRWRVLRQLLTENLLLALGGGALGLLLAHWLINVIVPLVPRDLPRANEIGFDRWTLLLTLLTSFGAALLCGLTPAWQATKVKLTEALKDGGHNASENRRSRYWRNAFVVVQLALTLVLLIGAGLLANSLGRLYRVNPGFNTDNLLTMHISLPRTKDEVPQRWNLFWDALLERTRAQSGVQQAAAVMPLPLGDSMFRIHVRVANAVSAQPDEDLLVSQYTVSDSYFETLGLRLVSGRFLSAADQADATPAIVVNETFVQTFFPQQSALGQTVTVDSNQQSAKQAVIVGIVADTRVRLNDRLLPQVYKSIHQFPAPSLYLVARTVNAPEALAAPLRAQVFALDKNLPVGLIRTMDEILAEYARAPRFYLTLLGGFALLALLMAVTGIYGVLSYTISQRTRELGIRLALGAQQRDVLWLVLKQGAGLILGGVMLGLLAAFGLTRLLKSLLFGVSVTDPLTFTLIVLALMTIALVACYLPARRATRIDPLVALRHD